ncbi:MAG TPA: sialidase family protein [Bryobacteraceae bacterium]
MRRCRTAGAFVLIAVANMLAQSPLPRAPHASIQTVSPLGGHYSEPGIAINPRNPQQIVAVFQGGAAVQGISSAVYSNDSGKTFTLAQGTKAAEWKVAGDVSTAFDNKGNAFLCYLTFDRLGTSSYWAHAAGRNGIFVRRSNDGGKIWDKQATALKEFATDNAPGMQFEDMPRIFADVSSGSPYAGNLYVGWIEWQLTQSIMLFSRSVDAGKTWSAPIRISTHAGLPRDDNGSVGGIAMGIDRKGTIYAIWHDGNSIVLTTSHDGGKSFEASRPVIETAPPYFGEVPGVSRVEGFPQIAVDARGQGKLYVCWSDYRNGDIDVFLASSADSGRTWSKPMRVNSDTIHNGKDQFYQWMAVDSVTNNLYVDFYDRRDDPKNIKVGVTLARSTDGGRTFTNYAWTQNAFDPGGAFLGDYTWIAAHNDHVYAAWTATAPQKPAPKGKNPAEHSTRRTETIIVIGTADFSQPR